VKLLTDFESVLGKFESGHRPPGAKRPSISTLASASGRAIAKHPGAGFLVVVVVRPQGEVSVGSPEGISIRQGVVRRMQVMQEGPLRAAGALDHADSAPEMRP
jgi:hypothetical protein